MEGPDAGDPVVAEEAVQDAGEVEPGDDEAAQVGDQGDVHGERAAGRGRVRARCGGEDGGGALEGEVDVEEGGHGLDGTRVLGVVEEVALAGLVFGVPFEDVELRVVGPLGGSGRGRRRGEGCGAMGEGRRGGVGVRGVLLVRVGLGSVGGMGVLVGHLCEVVSSALGRMLGKSTAEREGRNRTSLEPKSSYLGLAYVVTS